jgi:hypothetical protein
MGDFLFAFCIGFYATDPYMTGDKVTKWKKNAYCK